MCSINKIYEFISLRKISIFFLLSFLVACKKPQADFNLKQYEYTAGDLIIYDNLSLNYKSALWVVTGPDINDTFSGKNPNILVNILAKDGVYNLNLTTYSKKEKKSSSTNKTFLVKSVKGNLNINVANGGGVNMNSTQKNYDVYIDNQYIGSPNNYYYQISIPIGLRIVTLKSSEKELTKVVEIEYGSLTSITF